MRDWEWEIAGNVGILEGIEDFWKILGAEVGEGRRLPYGKSGAGVTEKGLKKCLHYLPRISIVRPVFGGIGHPPRGFAPRRMRGAFTLRLLFKTVGVEPLALLRLRPHVRHIAGKAWHRRYKGEPPAGVNMRECESFSIGRATVYLRL